MVVVVFGPSLMYAQISHGKTRLLGHLALFSFRAFSVEICRRVRKLEKAVAVSGVCSGVPEENSGNVSRKLQEHFSESPDMLYIPGFGAPGKANLPRTLGQYCPGPCPNLLCGVFFEINRSTVTTLSSFV